MNIQQSVETILGHRSGVSLRFYELLLSGHPELRRFFENVDLRHQAEKLQNALLTVQWNYTKGLFPNRNYLRTLGRMHREMGVAPEQFPIFVDALLRVLAEFHATDWSDGLRREWASALEAAVTLMREGYAAAADSPRSDSTPETRR